jgi:hypothetical protein
VKSFSSSLWSCELSAIVDDMTTMRERKISEDLLC